MYKQLKNMYNPFYRFLKLTNPRRTWRREKLADGAHLAAGDCHSVELVHCVECDALRQQHIVPAEPQVVAPAHDTP